MGPACDVGDNQTRLNARSFLLAEAPTIVNFGSQLSLNPKYWELRCVAAREEHDSFELDFQGAGANLAFDFDKDGVPTGVRGRDNEQFRLTAAFLKFLRPAMFPERRKGNEVQSNDAAPEALEKVCPAFSKLSLTDLTDPEKRSKDAAPCLLNFLNSVRPSAKYPNALRLAVHHKYIANLPIQLVFVTPEEAADAQAVEHHDYARDFQSLNSNDYSSADNPGHTMLFPAGTKLTLVLDRAESELARDAGTTSAADGRAVVEHAVKGIIGKDLPVPYSRALQSGHAAYLVQTDDGRFAMVMGGAMHDARTMEPYKFEKPPVNLTPQERKFRGTTDEFATAFPRYMEKAASAAGLNPKSYDGVTAYLIEAVRTCDGITPEMAQSATTSPIPRVEMEDVRKLGKQYFPCTQPFGIVPEELTRGLPRGVTLGIGPLGAPNPLHGWRDRKAMHVEVLFTSLPGDPRLRGASGLEALFANYGIVAATIAKAQ